MSDNPFDPNYKSVLAKPMRDEAKLQKARRHEVSTRRRKSHESVLKRGAK